MEQGKPEQYEGLLMHHPGKLIVVNIVLSMCYLVLTYAVGNYGKNKPTLVIAPLVHSVVINADSLHNGFYDKNSPCATTITRMQP